MNANLPIFCRPLLAEEFSILAPYFSVQTVRDTALLNNTLGWEECCGSGIRCFFTPGSGIGKNLDPG